MGPSTAVTRKLCAQVLEDTMKGMTISFDGTVIIFSKKRSNKLIIFPQWFLTDERTRIVKLEDMS